MDLNDVRKMIVNGQRKWNELSDHHAIYNRTQIFLIHHL